MNIYLVNTEKYIISKVKFKNIEIFRACGYHKSILIDNIIYIINFNGIYKFNMTDKSI